MSLEGILAILIKFGLFPKGVSIFLENFWEEKEPLPFWTFHSWMSEYWKHFISRLEYVCLFARPTASLIIVRTEGKAYLDKNVLRPKCHDFCVFFCSQIAKDTQPIINFRSYIIRARTSNEWLLDKNKYSISKDDNKDITIRYVSPTRISTPWHFFILWDYSSRNKPINMDIFRKGLWQQCVLGYYLFDVLRSSLEINSSRDKSDSKVSHW